MRYAYKEWYKALGTGPGWGSLLDSLDSAASMKANIPLESDLISSPRSLSDQLFDPGESTQPLWSSVTNQIEDGEISFTRSA